MIHYHGTPITPNRYIETMGGRHFCVSYAAPSQLSICLRIGASVMLDNGAFSAYTRGLQMDVDGFYRWLEPHLGHPHWAVVPDVIGGTVEQQREMVKAWPYPRHLGLPVWHLGMPLDYLRELVDGWPRLCLGSSGEYWQVGSEKWARRMDEVFNMLTREYGRVPWLHGLRMLGQSSGPWPLASADSTNIGRNFKDYPATCPECMALRLEKTNPPTLWNERPTQETLC